MTGAVHSSTSKRRAAGMPSEAEIEEFFASVERGRVGVRHFNDKYNYDFVRDEPMEEGRYEWVALMADGKSIST
ncbi:hypothetical protein MLD38_030906 [Melastoma candidum]|uniref:Uncharacterized protein n=1 Tax=Melastoma candidum TaxID=119954 RepID=A0ACB9MP97_9MYRT|nr:hypothetical protein MLD38_030906 [Melastoma candidum]